jgi:hypothetical protein
VFKPGKNCDGYFNSTELIAQVNRAIDIFEGKTNDVALGLFLFDNAPSHLKRATDAISATKMVKSASFYISLAAILSYRCPPRSQAPLDAPPKGATHA